MPTGLFRPVALTLLAAVTLLGCGEGAGDPRESRSPAMEYNAFYDALSDGKTDQALENLAPAGALGSTFHGGAYYMAAREFDEQMQVHGDVKTIVIDSEESYGADEVTVMGRIRFQDGHEMHRSIRFTREDSRWVGNL